MSGIAFLGVDGELITLADIAESWSEGMPFELRPPQPDQLALPVNEDDSKRLVSLVTRYPSFEPPMLDDDRDAVLVALIATSEGDRIPFEVALAIEELGQPAVRGLLRRIVNERHFASSREQFETFLSYLLDDPESRPTIADELGRARSDPFVRSLAQTLAVDLDTGDS